MVCLPLDDDGECDYDDDEMKGGRFMLVAIVAVVIIGGLIGYIFYQKKQYDNKIQALQTQLSGQGAFPLSGRVPEANHQQYEMAAN